MYEPIIVEKYCSQCGMFYTGTHLCPALFKTDYDRGYDAGRNSVKKEFKPIEIEKICPVCSERYTGIYHTCKSDFDRGYDAGKKAARREIGLSSFDELFPFSGK